LTTGVAPFTGSFALAVRGASSAGVALLLNAIAEEAVTSIYVSPVKLVSQVQLFCANWSLKFFSFCLSLFCVTLISERSLNA
jgi:hypothetical protein